MSISSFRELEQELHEIHDLQSALGLLYWDQQCIMPAAGSTLRGHAVETLAKLVHERSSADHLGRLLDRCSDFESNGDRDSYEASLVRVCRRDWEEARKIPVDLQGKIAQAETEGFAIWREARKNNDFASYLPILQRHLDLKLQVIDCYEPAQSPYDILLDRFEEGLTVDQVDPVFSRLKPELIRLTQHVVGEGALHENGITGGAFSLINQEGLSASIVEAFGVSSEIWRIGETAHPFQQNFGTTDIRLGTRYDESNLSSGLYSTIHEFGHGLYEAQVDPSLNRTLLCSGCSMTLHESQSRLMENLVGRSLPFLEFAFPIIRDRFPADFDSHDVHELYRSVNLMRPSLIRVEADELTYGLHIILRYEIEQDLVEGRIKVAELPEIWAAKIKESLGVDVPDDQNGVLQDVHWSEGLIGYFPEYLLGTVLSVQIWERMKLDLVDLDAQLAAGEFTWLKGWLQEHVHWSGRKFTPTETIERAVGGPLNPEPYLRYLQAKVEDIYGPVKQEEH